MKSIKTLRSEIERSMMLFGFNLTQLSKLADISSGNLSNILKKNRPITIQQIDRITKAFGYGEGWFYPLFIDECFSNGKVVRHKMISYLIRCSELNKFDCVELVIQKILEDQKNVSIIFSVAEALFENGNGEKAGYFYQLVIENEKESHSERLAISQYKLFRIQQGKDAEENWKAVIRFDSYRNRVPENFQLDALLQLATVCFTLHKWKDVEKYADELRRLAKIVYHDELRKSKSNIIEPLKTERHLVVYYGQGYLLKGVALEMQGLYEEAKKFVLIYADLGWFELLDDLGQKEIEKFRIWGKANMYTLDLLLGNIGVLSEYIDFLIQYPNEHTAGFLTIMKSANLHNFSVDDILERFSNEIKGFDTCKDPINISRHLHFRYQKALYEFRNKRISRGIDDTLRCLGLSDIVNHHQVYKRCVELLWKYRKYASKQQKEYFEAIVMKGGYKDAKIPTFFSCDNWINF